MKDDVRLDDTKAWIWIWLAMVVFTAVVLVWGFFALVGGAL